MARIATVVGLLLIIYVIEKTTLRTTAVSRAQDTVTETAVLRMETEESSQKDNDMPDDAVLFLPGFGAPLEKQVRH